MENFFDNAQIRKWRKTAKNVEKFLTGNFKDFKF